MGRVLSMSKKAWALFFVTIVFFAGLELIRKNPAEIIYLMPYVFYGLMGVSAFLGLSAIGVLVVFWWTDAEAQTDGVINQFMFAGILFCLAALCARLWEATPI